MDIEKSVKQVTGSIESGPCRALFESPVYVSVLITFSVVMILICIYEEGKMVKTGFYVFCSTLFFTFIHNKLMMINHKRKMSSSEADDIVNAIGRGPVAIGGVSSTSEEGGEELEKDDSPSYLSGW